MEFDQSSVQIEHQGEIAVVRMNRPEISNAVNPATMARLCQALDE